jgi:hypothetical protein
MAVTNRGVSRDTFLPGGRVKIKDGAGHHYEENLMASTYAQHQYETDHTAYINPDETRTTVVVFDIPTGSSTYVLTTGLPPDSASSDVLLDIR